MTYSPSESEKRASAIVQALAGIFLFVPPLILLTTTKSRRSPYIKYWAKVNLYWSLFMAIILITTVALGQILEIQGPAIVLGTVHFVFCVTGALSSYFNTPFRYWFVAHKCCIDELSNVYGQLVATSAKTETE